MYEFIVSRMASINLMGVYPNANEMQGNPGTKIIVSKYNSTSSRTIWHKAYLILAISFGIMTFAQADTFSFQSPSTTAKSSSKLLPVMSPDDYRKNVGAASQQNKAAIEQQVNQTLAKMPVSPPPPLVQTPSTPSSTTSITNAPTSVQTQSLPVNPSLPLTEDISPIQSTTNTPAPGSAPTLPSTPAPSTVVQPQQTQVYTGFQAAPPKNNMASPPAQSQQPKPSNWNIKY